VLSTRLRPAAWFGRPVPAAVFVTALVAAMMVARPAGAGTAPTRTAARPAATTATAPVRLTLPKPTGPYQIGTVALHLVDPSRIDPFVPGHRPREIMVQLWYPSRAVRGFPAAPWLDPAAVPHLEQTLGIPPGSVTFPTTHGHLGAPVLPGPARPVLIYSHDFGGDRGFGTAQVEDLASHGYVVATIDHTHDAGEVAFPDGRVEAATLGDDTDDATLVRDVAVRDADTRFLLDKLAVINAAGDPDAEHRPLPHGLRGALDLSRVGMFGHSLGGATAAAAQHDDRRIRAGVDLDGTLFGETATAGSDRPFLLIRGDHGGIPDDPTWITFLANQRGPVRELEILRTEHISFNDGQVLYPQLAGALGFTPEDLAGLVGTLDPHRSVLVQRAYLRAYFDRTLRRRDGALLDHPSHRFPEVVFVR
jgi:predicted dienelactone hydrolase